MKFKYSNKDITIISNFFKEYIFGFIYHDIDAVIDGKANFLAALGLLCYTEFLGGLISPRDSKNIPKKRFASFLPYIGKCYVILNKNDKLYDIFRCGLAHEYFIKRSASIVMYKGKNTRCGIIFKNDHWYFVVEKYFDDFRHGVKKYYNRLVVERNKKLIDNFFATKSINKWI